MTENKNQKHIDNISGSTSVSNGETLLKIENLSQHFKLGKGTLKAVDDVSFDVKKGEVFGIVGESGCGKTTTGRSIIRLYDITGGSVYFDGQRICAGTLNYKKAVEEAKNQNKEEIARLNAELKEKLASGVVSEALKQEYQEKINLANETLNKLILEQTDNIKSAKHDHKHCDADYAKKQVKIVNEKYQPLIDAESNLEKQKELIAKRDKEVKLANKDRIMNNIQMIFQDPIASLNPRMTVREIIAEGLIIRGIKDKEYIDEQVFRVLDVVGLVPEHANRYPHEFSGGQRQRIGIARSIILNPELIIADEPISALDVSIQAQVINLLNELRDTLGLTIIFIAHDLSVVKYFSDRIAVMYFGKIVELTTSDELFKHPLHPYTKSLLSAIPVPDPRIEKTRQRITYNPLAVHDYSVDKPEMREIVEGHFVYCNNIEFEEYQKEIIELDKAIEEKRVAEAKSVSKAKSTKVKSESKTKAEPKSTKTKATASKAKKSEVEGKEVTKPNQNSPKAKKEDVE